MIGEAYETTPLRVALLTYRGNRHSGGQGVYVRELSTSLTRLGHAVTVFSGQPYPDLDPGVALVKLPSLDLYRPEDPFRRSRPFRDPIDLAEFGIMCVAGFPEPLTFSLRAWRAVARRADEFDVVHDNQCLGYGLLPLQHRIPLVATIHHPIAVDARLELREADLARRLSLRRWYGFVRMQGRVARRLRRLITVSTTARDGIALEMRVDPARIAVVHNGVDTDCFQPRPDTRRIAGRVVATASADMPLKGLRPLLEAMARLRRHQQADLVVVGKPKANGSVPHLLRELGLEGSVRFVNGIPAADLVRLYAEAEVAVVPSLYEGFSFPAVEAMSCGVPLVSTTGGALPEVVGRDGDAALLVPPGDADALARAIGRVLEDDRLAARLGDHGRRRVLRLFSWDRAARSTVEQYRRVMTRC
ncbi:MAG: glycosyltransferase family 4 protein [Candidatus Dormibacteraeota bacterium]|nr:glycosyltransferase family 4 protein [Candidatus Dormibacteraeota bacterium]